MVKYGEDFSSILNNIENKQIEIQKDISSVFVQLIDLKRQNEEWSKWMKKMFIILLAALIGCSAAMGGYKAITYYTESTTQEKSNADQNT